MEFKLPDIGEGVHEGEIVRWLVKEGDSVAVDQPLVEIMTDKATVEIPTSTAGKVTKLSAKPGDIVKVGQTILTMDAGAGASAPAAQAPAPAPAAKAPTPPPRAAAPTRPPAPAPRQQMAAPAPRPQANTGSARASGAHDAATAPMPTQQEAYVATPGNVMATPATRRLARDLGIDLTQVPATGPNGRVTKEDVQKFSGASAAGPAMPASARAPMAPKAPRPVPTGERETLIPFRGIRRKISEAMVISRTTIPEFTLVDEVDVTELVKLRKELKESAEKRGVKLTYLPFIVKALVQGLRAYPSLNSQLDEQGGNIIQKNYFNIGIAVDTEQGLMVPNIKNADQKSIVEIAAEISDLAERARIGKLALDEMRDATFTITNPGPIGGLFTAPVINYPEVAILGVHKIVKRPVFDDNGQVKPADMMYLSICVDHRVVDGATGVRFLNTVMSYLSDPRKLLLELA